MVPAQRFAVGDRVCTIQQVADMPPGSVGTIRVLLPGDLCHVRFDGRVWPLVVPQNALALVAPARERP